MPQMQCVNNTDIIADKCQILGHHDVMIAGFGYLDYYSDGNYRPGDIMQSLTRILVDFFASDDGVTAIEYALLGGLIAVVIVVAVASVGTSVNGLFSYVAARVAEAAP